MHLTAISNMWIIPSDPSQRSIRNFWKIPLKIPTFIFFWPGIQPCVLIGCCPVQFFTIQTTHISITILSRFCSQSKLKTSYNWEDLVEVSKMNAYFHVIYMLFTVLGRSVSRKTLPLVLNAQTKAAHSSPWAKFFSIRTSQSVNNIYYINILFFSLLVQQFPSSFLSS